ncbi:MAG: TauD/TfdA family dioxygenase [Burkholderiales bacterium]|nr:TauD/TfdA family dioxygenase [Burkholderiales bacterium]
MTYRKIQVRQLSGAGGAEITGVDLTRADDDTIAEIQRALHAHLVVTLPDQPLDDRELSRFTARLGPFGLEPFVEGETTHPNVIAVVKEADETRRLNFGGNWHSDWSFLETPPSYTLLHARQLPPVGGDTLFANQYLAFESLSPGMQGLLEQTNAVHSARRPYGPQSHLASGTHLRSMKIRTGPEALAEFVHPTVRRHPDTGRSALYVNKVYTIRLEDMTEPESAGLLGFLCEHSVRPEFIIRVTWRPHMLTIWDNRVVQHLAVNDYDGHRREMHRTSVLGEIPLAAAGT